MAPQASDIRISAPGKVILYGEHSVVYGKLALAASLGLRTRLVYSERSGGEGACLNFRAVGLSQVFSLQDLKQLLLQPLPLSKAPSEFNFMHPELLDYATMLQAVKTLISASFSLDANQEVAISAFLFLFWAFLSPFDLDLQPFILDLDSELTVSAGTGSSASFAVTLSSFFLQFLRRKQPKTKTGYKAFCFTDTNLQSFNQSELELVSRWAFLSEKIVHGTPSGVDNAICTFGSVVEFRKGKSPKPITLQGQFTAILINTHVARDTKRLVAKVAERRGQYKVMVDAILDAMDEMAGHALTAVKDMNYDSLEELCDINHSLLRSLGVSHVKLDEICCVLEEYGLHGKLTGAGGGGYALCLVPPTFQSLDGVLGVLRGRGFEAVVTQLGGCGVSID